MNAGLVLFLQSTLGLLLCPCIMQTAQGPTLQTYCIGPVERLRKMDMPQRLNHLWSKVAGWVCLRKLLL